MKKKLRRLYVTKEKNAQQDRKHVEAAVRKNLGALRPGHVPSIHRIRALVVAQESMYVSPKISKSSWLTGSQTARSTTSRIRGVVSSFSSPVSRTSSMSKILTADGQWPGS